MKRLIDLEKASYIGDFGANDSSELMWTEGYYVGFLKASKLILTEEEYQRCINVAHELAKIELGLDTV